MSEKQELPKFAMRLGGLVDRGDGNLQIVYDLKFPEGGIVISQTASYLPHEPLEELRIRCVKEGVEAALQALQRASQVHPQELEELDRQAAIAPAFR